MGLDQYLTADRFYWSHEAPGPEATPLFPTQTVTVKAAYWRKSNQIHHWFVTNVQEGVDECQRTYISREQLQTLIEVCKEVLADHVKALMLLPPRYGFFGSTDFDEWYFKELENTVEQLTKALELPETKWDFYYQASW